MSHKLEIEITSKKDDGSWTWRAAGAKEPRGILEENIASIELKVGDILRADAEMEIDGIYITSIQKVKDKKDSGTTKGQIIEILGSKNSGGGVIATLVAKKGSSNRSNDIGTKKRDGKGQKDKSREFSPKTKGPRDPKSLASNKRSELQTKNTRGGADSNQNKRRDFQPRTPQGDRFKVQIGTKHKDQFIDSLPIEQRFVVDKLVEGGLQAVRSAITKQNEESSKSNLPLVPVEPIISMAEELLPKLNGAIWCDRAEHTLSNLEKNSVRDLRVLLNASEVVSKSESGSEYVGKIKEALDAKVAQNRIIWEEKINTLLSEGSVVRALKLSSEPPDYGAKLGAELASKLGKAASAAMTKETPAPRWALVLEAAAASPVRINVRPEGIPEDLSPEILESAKKLSGRIPTLAKLLGINIPPPPSPESPKLKQKSLRPNRPSKAPFRQGGTAPAQGGTAPAQGGTAQNRPSQESSKVTEIVTETNEMSDSSKVTEIVRETNEN